MPSPSDSQGLSIGRPGSCVRAARSLLKAGLAALLLAAPLAAMSSAYEGFGASTPGGSGKPVYHVTNLNDSGPGSLRDAVSQGNRNVVFDVGGTIVLASEVTIRSAFLTVDGLSAPPPGITLKNKGLIIRGTAGHDIIVSGLRIRDASQDGIWITDAAYNVVIDHVSVHNSFDGNIDITRVGTRDITVQWSILAEPAGEEKNMLLAFGQSRITLHHNLFIAAQQRSPQVTFDDSTARTHDTDTTLDMRNNLVWDWRGGYGTRIRYGGNANVVDNYYDSDGGDAADALIICKGLPSDSQCYNDTTNIARAYVAGNVSGDGVNLNNRGTETSAFTAPPVTAQSPGAAACLVRDGAGARPLDTIDQGYVATVSLPSCVVGPILTVTRSGSGTVTSSPGGISCGAACSASYAAGTPVTLTAIPAVGARFDRVGRRRGLPGRGRDDGRRHHCTATFTIAPANQTITFSTPANKTLLQSPATVTASASSHLPVTFSVTTPAVCSSGGVNGATIALLAAGTCTVQADQAGNASYNPAPSVSRSFTVSKASQTINFAGPGNKTLLQSPVTVSATATSGLPVAFASNTAAVCTTSGTNGATVTLLVAGTCSITATQPGSAVYNAATAITRAFTVTKASQTITFAALTAKTMAQSPVTVAGTASSGLTVVFTTTTPTVCSSGGANGATITLVGPGTCNVRANQPGNAVYAAATAINRGFTVTKVAQTITFATLPNRSLAASPFTVSATATRACR